MGGEIASAAAAIIIAVNDDRDMGPGAILLLLPAEAVGAMDPEKEADFPRTKRRN